MGLSRRRKLIVLAMLSAIVLLSAWSVRRPWLISYHRHAMKTTMDRYASNAPESRYEQFVQDWLQPGEGTNLRRFSNAEYHRKQLVALGFLAERHYLFPNVLNASPEQKALFAELNARNVGELQWESPHERGKPMHLHLWDVADRIDEWDEFVRERGGERIDSAISAD
jgi:hypothetical protein